MTKLRLSKLIDTIFVLGFCFLVVFCWLRFYTKNTLFSVLISATVTVAASIVFTKIIKAKNKTKSLSKQDKENAQYCALQFSFTPLKQVLIYFYDILKPKNNVSLLKTHLVLNPKTQKAIIFIPLFFKNEIDEIDIQNTFILAKEQNCNSVVICAKAFNQSATSLISKLKNMSFTLFDSFETYNKIIKPNNLPPKIVDTTVAKLTFSQILLLAFGKQRIKNYLIFGLILIASSFFVYYKLYYLISGSILLVLCIVILCLPNKRNNVPNN